MRPRPRLLALFVAFAATLLTACGGSPQPPEGAPEPGGAGTITVTDAEGEVTLPAPATRVVALEWVYAEDLIALGVPPVGVADVAGYNRFVTAPDAALPESVTDVGTRQEPSLEAIRALRPDLIITDQNRAAANADQLRDIAPTLIFNTARADIDGYTDMVQALNTIATATGTEQRAVQLLQRVDQTVESVRQQIIAAGKEGAPILVAQTFTAQGAPIIRLFTDNSLAIQLARRAGLTNAFDAPPSEFGFTQVGVEALTQVDPASTFLYVPSGEGDVVAEVLPGNAVWQGLEFVAQDRVVRLDPGTWLFGGPLSSVQFLEQLGTVLTP